MKKILLIPCIFLVVITFAQQGKIPIKKDTIEVFYGQPLPQGFFWDKNEIGIITLYQRMVIYSNEKKTVITKGEWPRERYFIVDKAEGVVLL